MTEGERIGERRPGRLSEYGPLAASVLLLGGLVGYYLHVVWPYVRIPADFLMFAESDFVGTIIKLRTGAPLFTPPSDNNSLVYPPLAPVLTYGLAWMAGQATSIPAYRVIQVGFAAIASVIGVLCCLRVYALRWPGHAVRYPKTFSAFAFLLLFLAATAPRVNAYASDLHADALAVVVTVFSVWCLLRYLDRPTTWRLIVLAACPAIGFVTKQFLLVWGPLACVAVFIDAPRQWRRVLVLAALSAAFYGLAVGVCYALWGDAFLFFIFEVVGGQRRQIGLAPDAYHISLIRSGNHLLLAWMEIMLGVVGAWWLTRYSTNPRLIGLVAAWALLIAAETLTSGAGWGVLYHFGPGVVVGTVLLLAAVPSLWRGEAKPDHGETKRERWPASLAQAAHAGFLVAAVVAIAMALHVMPTGRRGEARAWPPRPPSPDLARYVADIEREFEGQEPSRILLDIGNWIYLQRSYLARDRAISVADQPPVGIYQNIEAFAERIRSKQYSRILVRNFHSHLFLYDYHDWPRPSGVRAALLEHYDEVRTIAAVQGELRLPPAHVAPISVFEPKSRR